MVHKKVLEKRKVILRYTINLNLPMLGFETNHLFWHFSEHAPASAKRFKEFLLSQRETLYVTQALGSSNLESEFCTRNQQELYHLLDKIKAQFPELIANYEIMMVRKVYKNKL